VARQVSKEHRQQMVLNAIEKMRRGHCNLCHSAATGVANDGMAQANDAYWSGRSAGPTQSAVSVFINARAMSICSFVHVRTCVCVFLSVLTYA